MFEKLYKRIIKRKEIAAAIVQNTPDNIKEAMINSAIEPYGFKYELNSDLFYSKIDSWQRELGYSGLYDENAPLMNMVIESEPVYFKYNNKRWLIEFWKGQYGMSCGAEIGIYSTDKQDVEIPGVFSGPFFESASDAEMLKISMTLEKNAKKIFKREARHWWLTGFKLGEFAEPEELRAIYEIEFPDEEMRNAFLSSLLLIGYSNRDIKYHQTTVRVVFGRPKTPQPHRHNRLMTYLIQRVNHYYCSKYIRMTNRFDRTADRLHFASLCLPRLYSLLIGVSESINTAAMRKKMKRDMLGKL